MVISLELKNIHDCVMLDTLIDAWKAKWKADDEELKHDNAEDEPCDCDDESCEEDLPAEAKAHKKALDEFAKAMHDAGIADVSFTYMGSTKHMK